MQTQGISLVTSKMSGMASAKNTKASDTTFDSFMSNHASKVGNQRSGKDHAELIQPASSKGNTVHTESRNPEPQVELQGRSFKETTGRSQQAAAGQNVYSDGDAVEEVNVEAMANQMMEFLQTIFGMSAEEIQDILDQMGIQLQDLMFQIQDGEVSPVNADLLQSFVMELHGITDKAAFLTNDVLNRELSMLTDQAEAIIAEALGVNVGELAEAGQSVLLDFTEQLENHMQADSEDISLAGSLTQENSEAFSVYVETESGADEDQAGEWTGTSARAEDSLDTVAGQTENQTAAGLFTERLAEAFAQNDAEVSSADKTMAQIVEQVVNQVKIRILPETTSMELQLHPASLGRVNLQVSAANGVATATLTVENQMAKEALESQMITLKQTFDEQGLKVDAVEVTVSEFGLGRENQQASQEQQHSGSGSRKFRPQAGMEAEDDRADDNATEAVRRDRNSVVDYTA